MIPCPIPAEPPITFNHPHNPSVQRKLTTILSLLSVMDSVIQTWANQCMVFPCMVIMIQKSWPKLYQLYETDGDILFQNLKVKFIFELSIWYKDIALVLLWCFCFFVCFCLFFNKHNENKFQHKTYMQNAAELKESNKRETWVPFDL